MDGIDEHRDPSAGQTLSLPRVSIIVPTFNRVDRLRRVLDALAQQSINRSQFEVIVVSDGSTDGTNQYLHSSDLPLEIVAIEQPNAGPAAARNNGIGRSATDLVIFLDDDVIPTSEFVAQHLEAQDRQPNTVVIGPMLTPSDHEMPAWVAWEQRMLYKQYADMAAGKYEATSRQFYTGNVSLPRSVLIDCGGFDERFRRAEDVELGFRLGDMDVLFSFNDRAKAFHYAERSFDSWCDIATTYGHNDVIFAREPGREWIAPFIVWAFNQHHAVVRVTTRAAVASRQVERLTVWAGRQFVRVADRLPWSLPARAALSILYSVLYHSGAAAELGGSEQFGQLLRTGQIRPVDDQSSD